MGNIITAAKEKGNIEIKTPTNVDEIKEQISKLEIPPSEGLQTLWTSVVTGYFSRDYQVKIYAPATITEFKEDSEFDDFAGFSKIKGLHAYGVLQLWSDTDGRVYLFEMLEGDEKGKVVAFPFSDTAMYHSGKTVEDLLKVFENLEWKDSDDDIQQVFDTFFPPETRDNSPPEVSSDD